MEHKTIAVILAVVGFLGVILADENPEQKKMCWAHFVGWGFAQTDEHDQVMRIPSTRMLEPLGDRSLLGKDIHDDAGIFLAPRKHIETALAYGLNGFCVDIVRPEWYTGMGHFFRGAEGTPFKIALCMDSLNYSNERLLKGLSGFIQKFKDHPNTCKINGRMVIFVYNIGGKNIDEWLKVRNELKNKGLDAYYIVQPAHETSMWDNPAKLADALRGFEGFYDFGCNGFTSDEMKQRLANGRAVLDKSPRPDSIFCAGIAIGYIGKGSSFYRPFLNSGTLRSNWEAALANNADWVCLTTWNDYIESTQFEPSVINRDNLLRINREYLAQWRETPVVQRPPQVIYSYHEDIVLGDDMTLEVMNFSYTTAPASATVRLLDPAGKVLKQFPAIPLNPDSLSVTTLRLKHEEMKDWGMMRIQAAVTENGKNHDWRELYPITRRSGRPENVRTIRLRQDDIGNQKAYLQIQKDKDGHIAANIRLNSWCFAGKAELLRNGFPIMDTEIRHKRKPVWEYSAVLPALRTSPGDVYIVRFTDVAGRITFSHPVRYITGSSKLTELPVIVTGSDYDENWPLWKKRISRLDRPQLTSMRVPEYDVFSIRYNFDQPVNGLLFSTSGWTFPAQRGCGKGFDFGPRKESVPSWRKTAGPDGRERTVLAFDGKENAVAITNRAMPSGPFTIELWIKPETKGSEMILFTDNSGITLKLNSRLQPEFLRHGHITQASAYSSEPVSTEKWTHIAAVYDGKSLQIWQNGRKTAETPAPTCTNPINSVSRIGNTLLLDNGFQGEMAGFSLEGAVRTPGTFRLMKP